MGGLRRGVWLLWSWGRSGGEVAGYLYLGRLTGV